jgi:hypothetical protein
MRRIDPGPLLGALGGLVLLVSLFLHWYQPGLSAWTVFEVWDLVLAALALAGVWVALAGVVWEAPVREGALALIGAAAFVIVVSQLVNHPPAAQGASLQAGAWLGLGGSALLAVGGVLSGTSMSFSLPSAPRGERQPRPRGRPSVANEAAAVEPEVHDELYPVQERRGPIGADDPETLPFDAESDDRN